MTKKKDDKAKTKPKDQKTEDPKSKFKLIKNEDYGKPKKSRFTIIQRETDLPPAA